MAMMENTWLSVAMSSSVPVRAFVACVISFLRRLPDEVGEWQSPAVKGERGQQGGPGDARLHHRGEAHRVDDGRLSGAHAGHLCPSASGHGPPVRADDLLDVI